MTAVSIINLLLPLLAGLAVVLAIYFALRAVSRRSRTNTAPYNVRRQEARQEVQLDWVRVIVALVVSAILLIAWVFMPQEIERAAPAPTLPAATPAANTPAAVDPAATVAATETATADAITPTATLPSPTITPLPTATATPAPQTAVVSSGVGVWLRATPSVDGEQLEWLLQGAELVVLDERATADEFEWVLVRAASGLEGWVAVPFITINNE